MQSPIKDQLRSLLKREVRFDTLQNSRLVSSSKQTSSSSSTSFTSPNITSDTRDVAAQWLHEVVNDSKSPLDVFLLAVTLMDKFLDLDTKVTKTQVQLCASACLLIAAKLRIKKDHGILTETQIIQYTDNSIDKTELKVISFQNTSNYLKHNGLILASNEGQIESTSFGRIYRVLKLFEVLFCRVIITSFLTKGSKVKNSYFLKGDPT